MEFETQNVVNDTQDPNVEGQGTGSEVAVESETPEVASEQPTEKPVQSKEDNAKYADVRRNAEREAQDRLISEMYGTSHGIHTKADYDKAVREQKEAELLEQMRDSEADPKDIYAQLKQSDPDFQEYQKIRTESYTANQILELNRDLKDMGLDLEIKGIDDLVQLPNSDAIINHVEKGKTLAEAYFLANKKEIIASQAQKVQQETIKKIQANGSTPGSLADNGQTTALYTRDQVDNMSQADVNKNYDLIMKSMKTWK